MAKITLQNLNSQIIKNLLKLQSAKKYFGGGVGLCSVQENEALLSEIDRIVWALNLLDELRIDQGMIQPHLDHMSVYKQISLIYFWLDSCVNSLKKITNDSQ